MSDKASKGSGFTITGLLVTIALLAIMTSIAVPDWRQQVERMRLRSALSDISASIRQARQDAITLRTPVSIVMMPAEGDRPWCLGRYSGPDCDCIASSCLLDGQLQRPISGASYPGIIIRVLPSRGHIRFYATRGTSSAGSVQVTAGRFQAMVIINSLGRIRFCSNELPEYPRCA